MINATVKNSKIVVHLSSKSNQSGEGMDLIVCPIFSAVAVVCMLRGGVFDLNIPGEVVDTLMQMMQWSSNPFVL